MTELYASALHLDRKAVKALKITDPYSLHRVVYSLFPDIRTEAEKHSHIQSGIVYADQGGDFHGRKVLMVSDRPPMERVDGQYGDVISKPIAASFLD
ncbi:type I-E CRISPR-associated protein Cas6/Cse3/CasE, partial [Gilvimarinus sp. 1_MG-2023]